MKSVSGNGELCLTFKFVETGEKFLKLDDKRNLP